MTESWCDKLGSTPAAGFKFDCHFAPLDILINSLSPILDKEIEGDKLKFTIDRQERFQAAFTTNDGFQYSVEPSKLAVAFTYRVVAERTSAGPPIMRMLSEPLPYTQLIDIVSDRAIAAALLLPKIATRKVHRLGIMTVSAVKYEEIPPGVEALLSYWRKPWKDKVSAFNMQMTVVIDENENWIDRCLHTVTKLEEQEDDLVNLQFDWQRSFKVGRSAAKNSLDDIAKKGKSAALEYFEKLAEGSGFDASVVYGRVG